MTYKDARPFDSTFEEVEKSKIAFMNTWSEFPQSVQIGLLLVFFRKLANGSNEGWIRNALTLINDSVSSQNAELLEDWHFFDSPYDAAWLEYFWDIEDKKEYLIKKNHFPEIVSVREKLSRSEFVIWFSEWIRKSNSLRKLQEHDFQEPPNS
ncbi:MAG: hypothetical protein LCI00_24255 [Chloroflexi bacterium]|nr:hypothetical protein [Chloroflexota bacterium]